MIMVDPLPELSDFDKATSAVIVVTELGRDAVVSQGRGHACESGKQRATAVGQRLKPIRPKSAKTHRTCYCGSAIPVSGSLSWMGNMVLLHPRINAIGRTRVVDVGALTGTGKDPATDFDNCKMETILSNRN